MPNSIQPPDLLSFSNFSLEQLQAELKKARSKITLDTKNHEIKKIQAQIRAILKTIASQKSKQKNN